MIDPNRATTLTPKDGAFVITVIVAITIISAMGLAYITKDVEVGDGPWEQPIFTFEGEEIGGDYRLKIVESYGTSHLDMMIFQLLSPNRTTVIVNDDRYIEDLGLYAELEDIKFSIADYENAIETNSLATYGEHFYEQNSTWRQGNATAFIVFKDLDRSGDVSVSDEIWLRGASNGGAVYPGCILRLIFDPTYKSAMTVTFE